MQANDSLQVLGPEEGRYVQIGGMGVRYMVEPERGGGFALVEHPIAPRALAAPTHTHENEDEYTYVLEGEVGVEVGGEARVARPGELVFKPRGIPHAFWNAGDAPARVLEIISPAPFANYFAELEPLFAVAQGPDFEAIGELQARYAMTMDLDSIPRLAQEHGLAVAA